MATFPALTPVERTYSVGEFKLDRRDDLSGAAVRYPRSTVATGHELSLSFLLLAESEAIKILDHYRIVQGDFVPFRLRPETWCGTDVAYSDLVWRYDSPPSVQRDGPRTFSIEVNLRSVTTTLPARNETPIAPASTQPIAAETPPAPISDPYGTFFRAGRPGVSFGNDAELEVTTRAFNAEASPPVVAIESEGDLLREVRISAGSPAVAIVSGAGFAISFGPVLVELAFDLSIRGAVVGIVPESEQYATPTQGATEILSLSALDDAVVASSSASAVAVPVEYLAIVLGGSLATPLPVFDGVIVTPGAGETINVAWTLQAGSDGIPLALATAFSVGSELEPLSRASQQFELEPVLPLLGPSGDEARRDAAALSLTTVEPALEPSGDEARREALAASLAALSLSQTANPAYLDYTSGSPDEDAGFQEAGGSPVPISLQFALETGSQLGLPSRTSVALAVSFQLVVGNTLDAPRRTSQSVSVPSISLALATTVEPSFQDLTP